MFQQKKSPTSVSPQVLLFLMLAFILSGCSDREQEGKVTYDVVFRESLAGTYVKEQIGEQEYAYSYQYTDRGRGPDLTEELVLNDRGMITSQSIKGVNYRKTPVEETFEQKGTVAIWNNARENKEAPFDGSGLYFRYDGSPAIYEILAQRLLESASGYVGLYPEGEVHLSDVRKMTLSNGDSVTLLMITGLDMNPTYLWMQTDHLIGRISGNLHVIRQDFSDYRLEMKQLQDEVEDDYLISLANRLSTKMEEVVIQNVDVFTSQGTILPYQDVWVRKGIIADIRATGQPIAAGQTILDGTGKTLLPGLFDMHTHNTKFRGLLHLAGGVTSVKDMANNKQLKGLSAQFNRNEIMGPRIVTFCGIIDGSGPFANQRNVVENLEEALEEVQIYKDLGYQQIKLYSSIRPEWVQPLTAKAHALGMRVSGHIPAYMTAEQAINQGYNEIQHINMLFLNFLSDTIDTRTPLRHTMPARYGKDLDLTSADYKDFVQLLKSNDILVDLTLAIFENMYLSQRGEVSPTYAAIADRMPLMNQRGFYGGGLPKKGTDAQTYAASFDKMLEVINDLYLQGVAVVPGTDGLPGFLYHRELELYVQAGIPPEEVLRLATIKSAEITNTADSLGSVARGKLADLILIDGNPVENIQNIRRVEWTMKGGYLYDARKLYETQGIRHFNE